MEKKSVNKYIMWFLALVAVAFAIAGLYYTGATQKMEGFFSKKSSGNSKEHMSGTDSTSDAGSCSVGTCG
jgi:hypothetical protein